MSDDGRSYRIEEALGKGGFGTVYRADLLGPGGFAKPVALKVLNPDVENIDELAARLRDEARLLGLLHHRAITHTDGLVRLDGRWTVVMELVDGVSLEKALEAGAFPMSAVLEIIQEVASALSVAYDRPTRDGTILKLLHRDIKPANLQLTPNGDVKILDFGVARAEFSQREAKSQAMTFGSIDYMSPERFDGEDTHAGDVYALGVVLVELVSGKKMGRATLVEKRHELMVDEALRQMLAACDDDDIALLVSEMLTFEPTQRPTAKDVERRVRQLRVKHSEPPLNEVAEDRVPKLLAQRKLSTDELSGRDIPEGSTGTRAIEIKGAAPPAGPKSKEPTLKIARGTADGAPPALDQLPAGLTASRQKSNSPAGPKTVTSAINKPTESKPPSHLAAITRMSGADDDPPAPEPPKPGPKAAPKPAGGHLAAITRMSGADDEPEAPAPKRQPTPPQGGHLSAITRMEDPDAPRSLPPPPNLPPKTRTATPQPPQTRHSARGGATPAPIQSRTSPTSAVSPATDRPAQRRDEAPSGGATTMVLVLGVAGAVLLVGVIVFLAALASLQVGGSTPAPPPQAPATPVETAPDKPTAASWCKKGWAAVDSNELGAATMAFSRALSIEPENVDANLGSGTVLLHQKRPEDAKPKLCKAKANATDPAVTKKIDDLLSSNKLKCP